MGLFLLVSFLSLPVSPVYFSRPPLPSLRKEGRRSLETDFSQLLYPDSETMAWHPAGAGPLESDPCYIPFLRSIWSLEADLKTKMEVQLMGITPARKRGAPRLGRKSDVCERRGDWVRGAPGSGVARAVWPEPQGALGPRLPAEESHAGWNTRPWFPHGAQSSAEHPGRRVASAQTLWPTERALQWRLSGTAVQSGGHLPSRLLHVFLDSFNKHSSGLCARSSSTHFTNITLVNPHTRLDSSVS